MSNEIASEGLAAAHLAGLRYTSDEQPGIGRRRRGHGFAYVGRDGEAIRDKGELRRIRELAIPPAWTDVWISPSPLGHIQATGRDARGRKQYRYHARWREVRDEAKYSRLSDFAKALPRIRERVDADLARPGIPRERVLATAILILQETLMRIGNVEYARANGSFGLRFAPSMSTSRDRGSCSGSAARAARIKKSMSGTDGSRESSRGWSSFPGRSFSGIAMRTGRSSGLSAPMM